MKMIINNCFGGFGVRQEVLDELNLNGFSEEELRTFARLIEEIENGKRVDKIKRVWYNIDTIKKGEYLNDKKIP